MVDFLHCARVEEKQESDQWPMESFLRCKCRGKKRIEIDGRWRVSCIACVSRKNALKSMANDGFLGSLVRQGENAMKLMANGGFLALVGRV